MVKENKKKPPPIINGVLKRKNTPVPGESNRRNGVKDEWSEYIEEVIDIIFLKFDSKY